MRFEKPATTVEEQMALLAERGMACGDPALMERWLLTVGYYRLSAYWLPLEEPQPDGRTRSKRFRPGTRFEDVVDVYVFDRRLRLLVTEAVERVEIALRSRWTNHMALAHGPHAHLDPRSFVSGWDHARRLAAISAEAERSNEVFVEHYRGKYTDPYLPPLWMISELMSFGQLSKWLDATADLRVRDAVARELGMPSRETFEGTIQALSYVRNICAHHGRLWNRRLVKRVPRIKKFREDLVVEVHQTKSGPQHQPANLVHNALVVLIRLLRHQSPDTTFAARLRELVLTRDDEQLRAMGFPEDWRSRPAWRVT